MDLFDQQSSVVLFLMALAMWIAMGTVAQVGW